MEDHKNRLWKKMLEADYNYRFHLEQKCRLDLTNKLLQVATILASSAAVYLWIERFASPWAATLWVATAGITIVNTIFEFGSRATDHRVQAEMWCELCEAYLEAYESNDQNDLDHIKALLSQFKHLSKQEHANPSRKRRDRLYRDVLRSRGYSWKEIADQFA